MNQQKHRFGPWTIYFDPPPIPTRNMDWHFVHDNFDASYEGPEDGWVGNGLCGSGASVHDCLEQIAEIVDEQCYDCQCSATSLAECHSSDCPFRFKLETPLDRYATDMRTVLAPFLAVEAIFDTAITKATNSERDA